MTQDAATGSREWIAVIGDRVGGSVPQDSMSGAVEDAAGSLGRSSPGLRWISTELLGTDGTAPLAGASAVWCAPGGPYRSFGGALEGIRWAREGGLPFLGTCAGFQHGAIEFARNVLGHGLAAHGEYGPPEGSEVVIDEMNCSLAGRSMQIEVLDPTLAELYGERLPTERYWCRYGLRPEWRTPLDREGLRVAAVDTADGDVRVMRLDGHPYFVLTLFVPQASSAPGRPHPLVTGLVRAMSSASVGSDRS